MQLSTSTLLKISLTTALVSHLLLIYLSEKLEPKLIQISEINEKKLEQFVKISGKIESTRETESLLLLNVRDETSSITIVIFKDDKQNQIRFNKNETIEVIGKVSEFRSQLQVEASEIKKIN